MAISADSPIVGQTIGDVGIRARTGSSILAIERDDQTLANLTPETELLAEDILVVSGLKMLTTHSKIFSNQRTNQTNRHLAQ
ncbi:cation:proton antiporter regulatory subunit [Halalkalicoccus salilacus]|uniref:cation:proton antiporter regulatory subunit n=1 Tax=Halalkalicoccus salilacus TaxID=3117459 RepID=UPI0038D3DFDE